MAIAALVIAAVFAYRQIPLPPPASATANTNVVWSNATSNLSTSAWSIFRVTGATSGASASGPISSNYRLAGTFLAYGGGKVNSSPPRKAILDDLERKFQVLVDEGEEYRDLKIIRISKDHILIEKDGLREELWLSFSSDGEKAAGGEDVEKTETTPDEKVLGTSRFGKRVGDARWVLKKAELMNYYREMMDDPARAVDVYETMRPKYDENHKIGGYVVDIVGEKDFFDAVGLQNGDVVHKVNSMNMTSRNRAEYFIKEFLSDRINAVVIEVERGEERKKLIYLIR